jgi:uncharacterized protein
MEFLFPVAAVSTYIWLPPLVAFVVSYFTSMAGLSGAFLLLPFQMSVLGFTSPAVSPTNLVFNIVAIPSGVYRYHKEGRFNRELMLVVIAGTAPGVVIGGFIRLAYLPDPRPFKAFVGVVLLYVGIRLFMDFWRGRRAAPIESSQAAIADWTARTVSFDRRSLEIEFRGCKYRCSVTSLMALSLVVGVIGGIYGIGGGAIIAPFLVAIAGLPVHVVAGATLMATFATSVIGVLFYQAVAPFYGNLVVAPDWMLGALFGIGGLGGMYLGARTQRYVPGTWLKLMLAIILGLVSASYIGGYLMG